MKNEKIIKTDRERNIQLLRVISCFMVFFVHFGQIMDFKGIIRFFSDQGSKGVYLFFLISGYLAFKNFDIKKNQSTLIYYFKKFLRLAPIFYLVILVAVFLHSQVYLDIPVDTYGWGWKRYFFFANQIVPNTDLFWFNMSATWTIGIFAIFYLAAPFIKETIHNLKSSLIVTVVLYFVSMKLPYVTPWFNGINYLWIFTAGACCYYAVKENKTNFLLIVMSLLLMLYSEILLHIVCKFGIIILATSKLTIKNKKICNVLDILDKYSYAVYLIHACLIDNLYHFNFSLPINCTIILIGTIVLSVLVTDFIDVPINKFGKKIITKFHQMKEEI